MESRLPRRAAEANAEDGGVGGGARDADADGGGRGVAAVMDSARIMSAIAFATTPRSAASAVIARSRAAATRFCSLRALSRSVMSATDGGGDGDEGPAPRSLL